MHPALHGAFCVERYHLVIVSALTDINTKNVNTMIIIVNKYINVLIIKSKSKKQVRQLENAFVVKDGIEIGSGNVIPHWLFGLLY